jgi:multidrug efflux pump subunit AcrA (membrane-fusion protein)
LKKSISTAQYEYDNAVIEQDANVEQAQYTLDNLKATLSKENSQELEDLKNQLDDYVIYAPCDGVVSSLNVKQGLSIDDTSTPLAVVSNENKSEIIVYINDADILDVKPNMSATITVSGNSKISATGVISQVSAVKDVENKGYRTSILVENSDDFKMGMSVRVSIFSLIEKNVLSLSGSALIDNGEDVYSVYVLEENGDDTYTLIQKNIDCEWVNSDYVKITSDTIKDGDYVVANPSFYDANSIVSDFELSDEE